MATLGAAMLLAACSGGKDSIGETDHPDKAKITVTTTWEGIDQSIKPAEYFAAYGTEELKATQDTYTFPNLFDAGTHTAYFYNKPDGITINGTTATANYAAPIGWLFTGKLTETVEADRDYAFTVPMRQQVRELTLVIEPTGGTADKITEITASLSGAAGTLDFGSNAHGTPTSIALTFSKDGDGKWSATVRLLGVAGNEQKLTGTIKFTGGTPGDMPLETVLTTDLATFNDNKEEPKILGGTVAQIPTGEGFTATINGWNTIDAGTGKAN